MMKKVSKSTERKVENKTQNLALKKEKKRVLAYAMHCQGGGDW